MTTSVTTGAPPAEEAAVRPARTGNRRSPRSRATSVVYHVVTLTLVGIGLYPGVWMVASTFRPSHDIIGNVSPIVTNGTLENYVQALSGIGGVPFTTFLGNSLFLAVASVVGQVLSCSVTAYAFARLDFAGRGIWFACMIATLLLPHHVMLIPQYVIFQKAGLVNTFLPLLLGKYLATDAFFVFLMVQFVRGIPRELDEAAVVDGAGHVRIFGSIILPLLRPAVVTTAIFAFINSWNDFLGPLLYLKKPDLYTLPLALRLYVDSTTTADFGAQMAMAVLALIPLLLVFAVFQRYLVDGVSTTGIKG